jgi:hypothetical protein
MNSVDAFLFFLTYFGLRLLLPVVSLLVLGTWRERRAAAQRLVAQIGY